MVDGLPADQVIADKGYDTNDFRSTLEGKGIEAVIPSKSNRKEPIPYDKDVYKERNLVERFFNQIKHFRRIATRYEKTSRNFLAMLHLVATVIWLR